MAVDVSSVARMLNGFKNKEENLSLNLMTKDFLTGSSSSSSDSIPVLDLDLQVPSGWEKTLDLKSGKVSLKKRSSPSSSSSSSSSSDHQDKKNEEKKKKVRGLKFPVLEDGLELKLLPTAASSYRNQSVCTLDKVKSALEREKSKSKSPSPDSESISSSSSSKLFAGGCPGCLLYVLISKENPNCPHCDSIVPSPGSSANKKPRIDLDLNLSL